MNTRRIQLAGRQGRGNPQMHCRANRPTRTQLALGLWPFVLLLAVCITVLLAGCTNSNVRSEHVVATITDVYEDKAPMGCMGTDWNTIVRLEDLRTAKLCGKWGKPGEKLRGCWESGHAESMNDSAWPNGFHLHCRGAK